MLCGFLTSGRNQQECSYEIIDCKSADTICVMIFISKIVLLYFMFLLLDDDSFSITLCFIQKMPEL